MTQTTVFSIIRNGINNGYPFIESYGSWLPFCDRLIIYDGVSDDGTDMALKALSRLSPKVSIRSAPWPKVSRGGSAIAEFTDKAFADVRTDSDNLIYIQADELVDPRTRHALYHYTGGAVVQLTRYILFWNSFFRVLGEERVGQFGKDPDSIRNPDLCRRSVEWKSFRLFPSGVVAKSLGDGLTFDIGSSEFVEWENEVFHYGWCFPVNILQKHISHARVYPDNLEYLARARDAKRLLFNKAYSPRELDRLDPKYLMCAVPFSGEHVPAVNHLLGLKTYDPFLGLQLLKGRPEW